MLSLGAVAFDAATGKELGEFYRKLHTLPGADQSSSTMQWWATQLEAWTEATRDPQPPFDVMREYTNWLLAWEHPIMLAATCGFDFTFVRWYLVTYIGEDRRWLNCIDLRSAMMETRGKYSGNFKKQFKVNARHTHKAVDDAREQGQIYFAWALREKK